MAILKIARMGHSVLVEPALTIDDPTAERIQRLIGHMAETLSDAEGLGLAAPQVYQSSRLILFRDAPDREGADDSPPVVLINPEIEPIGTEMELGFEGCLSIPGLQGIVPRYKRIGYRGLDPKGRPVEREAEGLHARVVQHEVDHLNGILYIRRMDDLNQLTFESEIRHVVQRIYRQSKDDERQSSNDEEAHDEQGT
ncbi:MAG: peptide deformylase [Geminicoccaceae bacterium]